MGLRFFFLYYIMIQKQVICLLTGNLFCCYTNPLIRIPVVGGEHTRIELRSPDPTANPYLTIAACLMAGLDGIRNKIEPPKEIRDNVNALGEIEAVKRGLTALPTDLLEACEEMKKDTLLKDLLGERVFEQYLESKVEAWKEYDSQVTKWEIKSYLYKLQKHSMDNSINIVEMAQVVLRMMEEYP